MRLVATDAPDEHLVAACRAQRRRHVLDDQPRRGAQQLPRLLGRQRLPGLEVDGERVAYAHRHAHAGDRDTDRLVLEDLARLEHHLALLVGVIVAIGEVPGRADDVEGDRLGIDARWWRRHAVQRRVRLGLELLDCGLPGARHRLIGRDDDPLQSHRAMDRRERHEQRHRRAVRVRDQPAVALQRVRVDLRDDQRHVRVAPEGRGVVDHGRSGLNEPRRPDARAVRARREQRDVEALDLAVVEDAHRQAVDLAAAASALRRTGRSPRPGTRRSRRSSSIVVPTTPVPPTTATRKPELISVLLPVRSRRLRGQTRCAAPGPPGARV